jgi:tape measure domain-containing protein
MATERIDIVIREDGSRVVRRNIESIAPAAERSASAVDFLKRSLVALGGVTLLVQTVKLIDTFTHLQNRLSATGIEGNNLTAVYRALLDVSNETRSSVEGSVELYSRLALSSKELGTSQQDLVGFTKSLNQAIILSGSSAQEAHAGLIQLSQGLASNRLSGDELRSVLEQLPAVADVIARGMGVTRGELRKLGEQGKITGKVVLDAFKLARVELEERFKNTIPTIGQSFQVLKNNVIDFLGRLDQATGFSKIFSQAILLIANNLDRLASAVVTLTKVLITAAAAYGTFIAAGKLSTLTASVQAFIAYRNAIASGTFVLLGSAEAERQRAVAALAGAVANQQAVAAQTAASVATARAAAVTTSAQLQQVAAQQAGIALTRQELVTKLAKANAEIASAKAAQQAATAAGAQSFALATLQTATASLARAEAARTVVLGELAAAGIVQARVTASQTAATAANAAANTRLAQAQAAASASTAAAAAVTGAASAKAAQAATAAAGSTSLLGQAFAGLGAIVTRVFASFVTLFAFVAKNPFTILAVALVTLIGLLITFQDKILLGIDSITTLGDFFQAFGEIVRDVFRGVVTYVQSAFGPLISLAQQWFSSVDISVIGIIRAVAKGVDFIINLWRGTVRALVALMEGVPPAIADIFTRALNLILGKIGTFVNKAGQLLNSVTEFVGLGKLVNDSLDLKITNEHEGAAKRLGKDISNAFSEGFKEGGPAEGFIDKLTLRAREIALERRELEKFDSRAKGAVDTTGGKPAPDKPDEKASAKAENALRSLLNQIRPAEGAVLELAKAERVLNEAVKHGLITRGQANYYLEVAAEHYRDIIDPVKKLNRDLDDQTRLLQTNSHEREVEAQLLAHTIDLRQKGEKLSAQEIESLRARLQGLRDLNELTQIQDGLLQNSVDTRRQFLVQLQAIQNLLKDTKSGFSSGDAAQAIEAINPEAFRGTETQLAALEALYANFFDQIDQLRKANLIKEETASKARVAIAIAEQDAMLKFVLDRADTDSRTLKGTGAQAVVATAPELFKGTEEQARANEQTFATMYARINAMRQADIISEKSAAVARMAIASQESTARVQQVLDEAAVKNATPRGTTSTAVNLANPQLFEGTQTQLDANVQMFSTMYAQIDALRQADLISEQTANQARAQVAYQANAERLKNATFFFSNLAQLSKSENKKIAAIGRAAAITQATIDGVLAVQKALASAPPPVNYALAAAVGAAAAANVAQIASQGYRTGGYTGDGNPANVAGVVHRKEFVVNEEGTKRNRLALEAMNRGGSAQPAPPAEGQSSAHANAQGTETSTGKFRIINVLDPAMIGDFLATEQGEQVLVNSIRRNSDSVRSALEQG